MLGYYTLSGLFDTNTLIHMFSSDSEILFAKPALKGQKIPGLGELKISEAKPCHKIP